MSKLKLLLHAFVSGFIATLVFHQGLIALFYALDIIPASPFNMAPTKPLGVPSVISLAFFGGLWGALIWSLIKNNPNKMQLIKSIVFGAIGPTAIAFLVVFPLKGANVPLAFIPLGLLLNGFWGLGLWLLMKIKMK